MEPVVLGVCHVLEFVYWGLMALDLLLVIAFGRELALGHWEFNAQLFLVSLTAFILGGAVFGLRIAKAPTSVCYLAMMLFICFNSYFIMAFFGFL